MEKIMKVKNIKENTYFNDEVINKELIPGMILNYAPVPLALLYINKKLPIGEERVKAICEKCNLTYSDGRIYDKNNNELGRDYVLETVLADVDIIIDKEKTKDTDYSYSVLELAKEVLLEDVKPLVTEKNVRKVSETIPIEDLMSKLYGNKEEGGIKK